MVFSSVPLYLDPPHWQQQQIGGGTNQENDNQHLIHPTSIPNPPPPHMGGGGGGGPGGGPQIRPNSMAERARLAKIPPPEAPLKCPRCDSTNTKFCYFNNYSLSQPRHFCKTCRRYWTRGGALRNVPVGGGCRRNKRSSSNRTTTTSSGGGTPSSTSAKPSAAFGDDVIGGGVMTSFMASLQDMAQLGMGNLGLTFGGKLQAPPLGGMDQQHPQFDFNLSSFLSQRHHAPGQVHFPNNALSGAFDQLPPTPAPAGAGDGVGGTANIYLSTSTFQNDMAVNDSNLPKSTTRTLLELAHIKMEGERQGQGLNLAKQLMMTSSTSRDNNNDNNQFWGSGMDGNSTIGASNSNNNMWSDFSGLSSSSTRHLM